MHPTPPTPAEEAAASRRQAIRESGIFAMPAPLAHFDEGHLISTAAGRDEPLTDEQVEGADSLFGVLK